MFIFKTRFTLHSELYNIDISKCLPSYIKITIQYGVSHCQMLYGECCKILNYRQTGSACTADVKSAYKLQFNIIKLLIKYKIIHSIRGQEKCNNVFYPRYFGNTDKNKQIYVQSL